MLEPLPSVLSVNLQVHLLRTSGLPVSFTGLEIEIGMLDSVSCIMYAASVIGFARRAGAQSLKDLRRGCC